MPDQNFQETTVAEARAYLNSGLRKGVKCPCCTQYCRVYKRQIHSTIARMLIKLYGLGSGHHYIKLLMPTTSTAGGDFSLLRYWGLVEEMEDDGVKDSKNTGYWKITETGKQFVRREIPMQKHAEVYNGKLVKLTGDDVLIDQCLGKRFSYWELMS